MSGWCRLNEESTGHVEASPEGLDQRITEVQFRLRDESPQNAIIDQAVDSVVEILDAPPSATTLVGSRYEHRGACAAHSMALSRRGAVAVGIRVRGRRQRRFLIVFAHVDAEAKTVPVR